MRKDIHPKYQQVLFVDTSTGVRFVCGSTLQPKDKETFEGKEYPVYRVSVSSASHPLYTGSHQFVDAEGRVDKFRKRYSKSSMSVAREQVQPAVAAVAVQAAPAAPKAAAKAPAAKAPAKGGSKAPAKAPAASEKGKAPAKAPAAKAPAKKK